MPVTVPRLVVATGAGGLDVFLAGVPSTPPYVSSSCCPSRSWSARATPPWWWNRAATSPAARLSRRESWIGLAAVVGGVFGGVAGEAAVFLLRPKRRLATGDNARRPGGARASPPGATSSDGRTSERKAAPP